MDLFQHFLTQLKKKNLEQIQMILKVQPSYANRQDEQLKRTPIFVVPSYYDDNQAIPVLSILIDSGANINHEDVNQRTVAFILCSKGMINCLKVLRSRNQSILSHKDRLGQTPLFAAVRQNQLELIKELDLSSDLINIIDDFAGQTILFYAASCGHEKMCKYLYNKGADLLIADQCGQNILSYTENMPKVHNKFKQAIRRLQSQNQKQQIMEVERNDKVVGKQGYSIQILQKNRLKKPSNQQRQKIVEELAEKPYAESEKLDIDEYDEYLQNWRHLAIKIINKCLRSKAGRWFNNILKGLRHISKKQLKKVQNIDLMDFNTIKIKLDHHIYNSPMQFVQDMRKIWVNCQRMNSPQTLVYRFAEQLKNKVYKLMVQYNFTSRY